MLDTEEKLRAVLDDYFGEGNNEYDKDQIVYFLEAQGDRVLDILKEELGNR